MQESLARIEALRDIVTTATSQSKTHVDEMQHVIESVLSAIPRLSQQGKISSTTGNATSAAERGMCTQPGGNDRTPLAHLDCTQLHDCHASSGDEHCKQREGAGTGTALNLIFSGTSDEEDGNISTSPGKAQRTGESPSPLADRKKNAQAMSSSALASTSVSIGGANGTTQVCTLPSSPSLGRTFTAGRDDKPGILNHRSVSAASSVARPPSSMANRQHSAYDTISSSLIDDALKEGNVREVGENEATAAPGGTSSMMGWTLLYGMISNIS